MNRDPGTLGKIMGYRKPSPDTQPDYLHPAYVSSRKRAPSRALISIPSTLSEVTGPLFASTYISIGENDLTRQHQGEPLGERIIVSGKVVDEDARPLSGFLIELWQANAAGRYAHRVDQHNAPLDPNFSGYGRAVTDAEGRYTFITIKPGAYPWANHDNAWRPAHIHFSILGPAFAARLVTQMYFPGDPLLAADPIFNSIRNETARNRLVSTFDWQTTSPGYALGYCFDIVLRGREQTPMGE
jgi:protocatechuate 3,4-dioxygenase, beta subunit